MELWYIIIVYIVIYCILLGSHPIAPYYTYILYPLHIILHAYIPDSKLVLHYYYNYYEYISILLIILIYQATGTLTYSIRTPDPDTSYEVYQTQLKLNKTQQQRPTLSILLLLFCTYFCQIKVTTHHLKTQVPDPLPPAP